MAWLAALPWELLCRDDVKQSLSLDPRTPIVRYLQVLRPMRRLPLHAPLRVLLVISHPADVEPLNLEAERRALEAIGGRDVEISVLETATVDGLRRALQLQAPPVLHFMGHGLMDPVTGQGSLLFETEDGSSDPVDARTLASLLAGAGTPQLVVLNACDTGRFEPSGDPFGSVAAALVRAGVSAVVATQLPISDEAAIAFSEALYEQITAGEPLETAVAAGRRAVFGRHPSSPEWAIPVLFTRMPDGRLFRRPIGGLILAIAILVAFTVLVILAPAPLIYDPACPSPPGLDMAFVKIPAGKFRMGSRLGPRDQKPLHWVEITRPFCLGLVEVTQRQWKEVMGSNPSVVQGDDLPVEHVSWHDTQAFFQRLNELDPSGEYRLPTEAEWEYAARGGKEVLYGSAKGLPGLSRYGNCREGDGYEKAAPVGRFRPTAWGLRDLHGNVWEWVEDVYGPSYPEGPVIDPRGPLAGEHRVRRGGSWDIKPENCSAVHRARSKPDYASADLGFRVVRRPVR